VAVPKLPVPVPSRIETLLEVKFAVARSLLPSLLKSPTAIELGPAPTGKLVGAPKLPVPVPSRIETLLEAPFAVARSLLPSLLKSPIVTEAEFVPAAKSVLLKLGGSHEAGASAVVAVAELFVVSGSVSFAVALAVLVMGPEVAVTLTTMLVVAVAPLARLPMAQVTVLLDALHPLVAETNVVPDGKASVKVTPVADIGPLLRVVIV